MGVPEERSNRIPGVVLGLSALVGIALVSKCGDGVELNGGIATSAEESGGEDPNPPRSFFRRIIDHDEENNSDEENGLNGGRVVLTQEDGEVKNPVSALRECIGSPAK